MGGGKIKEFRYIFDESGVDIVCVSETWFKPGMPDNLYQLKGYKILRADRISHAGGVEFLHDNSVTYNNIVIAADLNSNLLTETSLKADFASLGLYPCNTVVPTHFISTCNTLLDLFFVNDLSKCLLYDQMS